MLLSFYDFKLNIYLIFLYTFDRVYVTFVVSEFSKYNEMKRMHHGFDYICSNFHIAELLLDKPDHRNNQCSYICRF